MTWIEFQESGPLIGWALGRLGARLQVDEVFGLGSSWRSVRAWILFSFKSFSRPFRSLKRFCNDKIQRGEFCAHSVIVFIWSRGGASQYFEA